MYNFGMIVCHYFCSVSDKRQINKSTLTDTLHTIQVIINPTVRSPTEIIHYQLYIVN